MASLLKIAPSAAPSLLKAQRGSSAVVRPAAPAAAIISGRKFGLQTRNPQPMVSSVVSPLLKGSNQRPMEVRANASADGAKEDKGMGETLLLGALFAGWYAANIIFNIYNKTSLKSYPCPLTITCFQFVFGGLLSLFFWCTGLIKWPKITWNTVNQILPLAVVHTLGNLLTNVSLGAVAVSFTHTIKAMEPFFSVVLSSMFLGDKPSIGVILALLPIVGGVAAASLTEPSFNWTGFLSAMGSNLTFQSRNVLSKKLMDKKTPVGEEKLDKLNIFALITIFSGFLLAPIALMKEGLSFLPANMQAAGITDVGSVYQAALLAALCFHTYQQVSYLILSRVSPVTHSVGNCVKRVIVIVASVIFFQNPVSTQNAIGTAVALGGVFLYSQVKRLEKNAKPKAA